MQEYDDGLLQEKMDRRIEYMRRVAYNDAPLPEEGGLSTFISWLDTTDLTDHEDTMRVARGRAMAAYLLGGQTIREAREFLMTSLESGKTCPCCGQLAKRYKRKLNKGMAQILIWLEGHQRTTGERWVRVANVAPVHVRRSNEISRLRCWGLVTEATKDEGRDNKTSGLYRISQQGLAFVRGEIEVPSHVYIYNNKVMGVSEDTITVSDALGEPFSYRELLG